jgi:glycerol-3-phosphate dehydrogenase (NAD(P)+)
MNLTVLGCGAWGTALAAHVAVRHPTWLWARDAAQAAQIREHGCNERYLPGVMLPAALAVDADLERALDHARDGLVIVATPMSGLREMLQRVGARSSGVLWLCKGLEPGSGLLGHEVMRSVGAGVRAGVLSGPSFAIEVARGQPTALVVASLDASLCADAVHALHSDQLRVYTSDDPVGVEIGGSVKNVMAIATGLADGMRLGLNARAALITRGLAEMTRLGVALGGRAQTFMGLSGLGDLVLTCTGDLSRNRSVGLLLAQGLPLPRILAELGHVAEGVQTAPRVRERARALGVDLPITDAVVRVLDAELTPTQAVEQLMRRDARAEA